MSIMKPGIEVIASFSTIEPLDEVCRNLIKSLDLIGLPYKLTNPSPYIKYQIELESTDLIDKALNNKIFPVIGIYFENILDKISNINHYISFLLTVPDIINLKNFSYNINSLNLDYILIPTKEAKIKYTNYFASPRLKILPFPMELPSYWEELYKFNQYKNKYVFYSIMYPWFHKKNISLLIEAFNEAFKDKNDILLYLKIAEIGEQTTKILDFVKKYKNIIVNTKNLTDRELWQIHKSFNAFINISNMEGWSYPIHQALLAGNFVITSDNSGIASEVKSSNILKVKSLGYKVDKQDIIDKLIYAYQNKPIDKVDLNIYGYKSVSNTLLNIIEEAVFDKVKNKIEGYMVLKNGLKLGYPFVCAIKSILPLISKFIVLCDGKEEEEILKNLSPKIRVIPFKWDEIKGGATSLVYWENEAMRCCSTEWTFKLQADEIYDRIDLIKIGMYLLACEYSNYTGLIFNFIHHIGRTKIIKDKGYQTAIRVAKRKYSINIFDGYTLETYKPLYTDINCHHYGWLNYNQSLEKALHKYEMDKDIGDYYSLVEAVKSGKLHEFETVEYLDKHPDIVYREGIYDIMED